MPPDQRTNYHCDRAPTGPLNRRQLIEHINKVAIETPDQPEAVPYVPGTVRGKKVIDLSASLPFVLSTSLKNALHEFKTGN